MKIFAVSLDTIRWFRGMFHDLVRAQVIGREADEIRRKLLDLIVMVLHHVEALAHAGEQRIRLGHIDVMPSFFRRGFPVWETVVFTPTDRTDFSAERQGKGLMPATNSDYRDAHILDDGPQGFEKLVKVLAIASFVAAPRDAVGTQGEKSRLDFLHIFDGYRSIGEDNSLAFGS